MTGGVSLPTNGFQFANASDLGHLLSFPMQTHEVAFMQGLPDGSNVWDGAGVTNASPHNGQVFAAFSMPDPLYSLAMLPCRHLACNKTFKGWGGHVSPRAKRSSQESRASLVSLPGTARATLWIQSTRQGDGASVEEARQLGLHESLRSLLQATFVWQRVGCCQALGGEIVPSP
jgi:hypothetical protein